MEYDSDDSRFEVNIQFTPPTSSEDEFVNPAVKKGPSELETTDTYTEDESASSITDSDWEPPSSRRSKRHVEVREPHLNKHK
jgi:hypothetical protein